MFFDNIYSKESNIMASLIKLLQESILVEGRLEQVINKYQGKVDSDVITQFSHELDLIDPKINNKYLDWMVKQRIKGYDFNRIVKAVTIWHKNIDKIDLELIANRYDKFLSDLSLQDIIKSPKDINAYPELKYLEQIGLDAENKLSKTEEDRIITNETRLVYEDSKYIIRVPLTHRASCKYGRGTSWCTRLPDNDQHFKSYSKDGFLFYVIDKSMPSRAEHPMYKVAVLIRNNDNVEIYNARDVNIGSNMDTFFPPEMVSAMKNYKHKYLFEIQKYNGVINTKIGEQGGEINGWILKSNGGKSYFQRGEYIITIDLNIKEKEVYLNLILGGNSLITEKLKVPVKMIKDVEDIIVNNQFNKNMLQQWIGNLKEFIFNKWNTVMETINPIIESINVYNSISKKINSVTGNWKFVGTELPSETNKSIEFSSNRTINVDGENYKYILTLTLDFYKTQYIFGAVEDRGSNKKEAYENQHFPFDPELIKNQKALVDHFLNWASDIVSAIYDEESGSDDNIQQTEDVKSVTGKYNSPKYGTFTVDIDVDNKIHVHSDKLNVHYYYNNISKFQELVNKFGLKKI